MTMVSIVIPANDQMNSIGDVIKRYCEEIIVVDDGSTDEAARVSREQGARVIQNNNPAQSIFSPEDIEGFKKKAGKLNYQNRGDQAAFYLKKQ